MAYYEDNELYNDFEVIAKYDEACIAILNWIAGNYIVVNGEIY